MANSNLPRRIIKEMQWLLSEPGGVFKLELFLPEEYPMAAPKMVCSQNMPLAELAKHNHYEPDTDKLVNPTIAKRRLVPGELTAKHTRGWRSAGPPFSGLCYCPPAPIVRCSNRAVTFGTKMVAKGLGWDYHDVEHVLFPRGYKDWGIEILRNHALHLRGQKEDVDFIYGAIYCSLGDYFISPSILRSLIEKWDHETNTFLFCFGERTVTLLDMNKMVGFPLDGEYYKEYVPPVHELEPSLLPYPAFLKDLIDSWDKLVVGGEVKFQAWCGHFYNRRSGSSRSIFQQCMKWNGSDASYILTASSICMYNIVIWLEQCIKILIKHI